MATLIGTASNQIPTNGDLGTMAFQDSASISVGAISIGSGIPTIVANATAILVGNSTVNATINSTSFSGTSANATNLNSQPYTYYTNAGNITSGTLPYAQIPANVINTTANFTIPGIHTHNGGIAFSNTITANGSNGTAGQVLTSSGATGNVYWSVGGGSVTSIAFVNGLTGGTITSTGSVNVLAGNTQLISNTSGIWLDQTKVDITQLSNYSTVTGYITSNAATAYTNSVSYVTAQSFANTLQVTSNAATAYTNSVSYVTAQSFANTLQVTSNAATAYTNAVSYVTSQSFANTLQVTSNAATAYTNAITYSGNAAQAYSNAVTYITTANFSVSGMRTYANGITFSNTVTANGSNGTAGQVLTSSGATGNVYWAASVNTAAQYTWSNTQSFTNTITFANTNINNIVLSGNTSNVSAINFYVSSGLSSGAVGSLFWHNVDGTLNVQMDSNVSSALNQCQYFYVKASAAITIGQVCMITGAVGASGILTAGPATGVTDGTYIMGIAAENIDLNGFGYIQSFGPLKGFNLSTFADGDILFYDTASTGGLTKTAPSSPNPVVQVGAVIHNGSGSSGSIFIRVTTRGKLKQQGDVLLTTPVNSDVLVYNSATSLWVNSPTVNNATNLGGQPSTYYTSATNISSGTLADARLTANYSTGTALAANNSAYLGGTIAASYQLNSTLSANIASYLPTYTGVVNGSSHTVGTTFTANASNMLVGGTGTSNGVNANTTVIFVGNNTVNTTINATSFSGTAANATNLNSQPATYYTSATNISSGTLADARLSANYSTGTALTANNASYLGTVAAASYVNTSGAYTITGMHTYSNGITFANTVTANGSNGTSGQILTSSGATGNVYWSTITGATLNANNTDTQTFYPAMSNNITGSWSNAVIATSKFYFVPSTGTLSATIFTSLSDQTAKTNIQIITNATETIKQIDGVSFNWKDNNKKSYGVIAQNIEKILPDLVEENSGIKSVNYLGIIGFLIEAVKELDARLNVLESK